jgi:hypothetical protein
MTGTNRTVTHECAEGARELAAASLEVITGGHHASVPTSPRRSTALCVCHGTQHQLEVEQDRRALAQGGRRPRLGGPAKRACRRARRSGWRVQSSPLKLGNCSSGVRCVSSTCARGSSGAATALRQVRCRFRSGGMCGGRKARMSSISASTRCGRSSRFVPARLKSQVGLLPGDAPGFRLRRLTRHRRDRRRTAWNVLLRGISSCLLPLFTRAAREHNRPLDQRRHPKLCGEARLMA